MATLKEWKEYAIQKFKFKSFMDNNGLINITKTFMKFVWNLPYSKIKWGKYNIQAGWDYFANKNCLYVSDDTGAYEKFHEGDIIGFGKKGELYGKTSRLEKE